MVSVWASQLLSTLIMLITVWQINKLNLIELKGMLSLLDILMICCCMCWWYADNVIGAILALMWPYNTACMIRPHSLLPYAPTKTTEKLTLADLIFPQVYTTIEDHNMFTLICKSIIILSCCSISDSTLTQRQGMFFLVSYELIWKYNFV